MKRMSQLLAVLMLVSFVAPSFAQPAPASAPVVTVARAPVAAPASAKAAVAAPVKAAVAVPAPLPASQPAVVAPGAPGEASMTQVILKYVLDLFLLVVLALVSVLVKVLAKKYGFEAQAAMINDVLTKATGYAEQMASKKLKLDGKPTESAEKMKLALDFATKMAAEYKLGQKGAAWWEDKLEGWLGTKKVSG